MEENDENINKNNSIELIEINDEDKKKKKNDYDKNQNLKNYKNQNDDESKNKIKMNKEDKGEIPREIEKRTTLSLEGAKNPLSIYTRRVINISKLNEFLKADSSSGVCGGRNLGNTCFMNSSIACLSNCTELTYYFLSGDYKNDINYENEKGMKGEVAKKWGELLQEYWVEKTPVGDPSKLKSTIEQKAVRFRGNGQHDSNEFMSIFLDYLNEDLNSVTEKEYCEMNEKKDDESEEDCSKRFWEYNLKRNDSIITDLFCGQFKSTIICPKCKWESITFEPFYSINLPIKKNKRNIKNEFEKKKFHEYDIAYIPKYGIRTPYIIKFFEIPNTTRLNECFEVLKKVESFRYKDKLNQVNYMKMDFNKYEKEVDEDDIIDEYSNIFLFEIINEENNDLKIPVYFLSKRNEDEVEISQYPRFVTGHENMTLEDLKESIYFIIRKYILSPFIKKGEIIDEITGQINKYIKDMSIEDEYIFNLIDKEYKRIFSDNPPEEDIDQLMEYIQDLPFELNLRELEGNKIVKIFNDNNLNQISDEFKNLTDVSSLKEKLTDCLYKMSEYCLIVEFKIDSKYINKNNFKLNMCLPKKIKFPKIEEEDDKEEKKEEEYHKSNLVESLNYFCKEEQLKKGNNWYCKKCKENVLPTKRIQIYYLPKILIICFKRFIKQSMKWEKNEEDIDFPINNFDMKDLIIGPDKNHSKYDLFAVSQHYGSTGSGHYTAVCKNGNNWYKYDDSIISKTTPDSVLNSAAYVLFYRRQTD